MPQYWQTVMTNLPCSYFHSALPQQTGQRITIHWFIPVPNLQVCHRYREKNVTYVGKAIALIDRKIDFTEKCLLAELSAASCPLKAKPEAQLKWTGSIVEWVELLYSLHAAGVVGGGKASLKTLFQVMGEVFDFEVKEYSRTFTDIKNRIKGDRTVFIDKLKDRLLRRMEDADRKPGRK